jgi:hypothetical protein
MSTFNLPCFQIWSGPILFILGLPFFSKLYKPSVYILYYLNLRQLISCTLLLLLCTAPAAAPAASQFGNKTLKYHNS